MAKQESDTRTTVLQVIGGAVLFIGLYFTAKTLRTTQEGQITDRFTKAINQLGEAGPERLPIRLGGIYALERIAKDSERDHWPIMEVLTAYLRETSCYKDEARSKKSWRQGMISYRVANTADRTRPVIAKACRRHSSYLSRAWTSGPRTHGKGEDHVSIWKKPTFEGQSS